MCACVVMPACVHESMCMRVYVTFLRNQPVPQLLVDGTTVQSVLASFHPQLCQFDLPELVCRMSARKTRHKYRINEKSYSYLYTKISQNLQYNSVLTCRQTIINSAASAQPNATKIAVKKVSDVNVSMFGPEF